MKRYVILREDGELMDATSSELNLVTKEVLERVNSDTMDSYALDTMMTFEFLGELWLIKLKDILRFLKRWNLDTLTQN